ncbi:MAG: hypothetical protein WHS88_12545, partial [Anaerohalosphaeraceae bacterium]
IAINKLNKTKTYLMETVLGLFFVGSSICLSSVTEVNEVLSIIKRRENLLESDKSYSASFQMLNQACMFDPRQGDVRIEGTITWRKDNLCMKMLYSYLQNPIYVSPDTGIYKQIDYDRNRRLILWRPLEKYILSTLERTEIVDIYQLFFVSPEGEFEQSEDLYRIKHIFPSDCPLDGTYEFKHFLMASGIGFLHYLEPNSPPEIEPVKNTVFRLKYSGNYGKEVKGVWELILDPNTFFFVQHALFTNEKMVTPSVEVSTSRVVIDGPLHYASQGTLVFSGMTRKRYEKIKIFAGDNLELRQEVYQKIKEELSGTDIVEFTGKKPVRIFMK